MRQFVSCVDFVSYVVFALGQRRFLDDLVAVRSLLMESLKIFQ